MQLGDAAPELVLPDAVGVVVDLAVHAAECPALVLFVCNHCPTSNHVAGVLARLTDQ